jgi:hypothetical protein
MFVELEVGDLDLELMHLGHHMQTKVIGMLRSFIMFDPSFKNLQLIRDYIGLELAMQVVKYDQEVLMPLLLIVYKALTSIVMTIHDPTTLNVFELKVFGSWLPFKKLHSAFLELDYHFF